MTSFRSRIIVQQQIPIWPCSGSNVEAKCRRWPADKGRTTDTEEACERPWPDLYYQLQIGTYVLKYLEARKKSKKKKKNRFLYEFSHPTTSHSFCFHAILRLFFDHWSQCWILNIPSPKKQNIFFCVFICWEQIFFSFIIMQNKIADFLRQNEVSNHFESN